MFWILSVNDASIASGDCIIDRSFLIGIFTLTIKEIFMAICRFFLARTTKKHYFCRQNMNYNSNHTEQELPHRYQALLAQLAVGYEFLNFYRREQDKQYRDSNPS